jgi:SH3 domain-containing protein
MKAKRFYILILIAIALFVSACGTNPQATPYSPAIAVSPDHAKAGATISLFGAGFPPAANVEIYITVTGKDFPSRPYMTAQTNDKGELKATFDAPGLETNDLTKFIVFARTEDKLSFATSLLMVDPEEVAVNLPPSPTPEVSPTPNPDSGQPDTCEPSADKRDVGYVASETLNVRLGPGTHYQILTVLNMCDKVTIKGRTGDNLWVEVSLGDGRGGWVYGVYLKTFESIALLPFTAGSGGPVSSTPSDPSGAPASGSGIWIAIENNIAYVTVKGVPANQVVTLSFNAGNKSLAVDANSTSTSDGTAQFKFTMPAKWSDGTAITETNIWLTATAADGTTKNVEVIYYH